MLTVTTNDGKTFEINKEVFCKYSSVVKELCATTDDIVLPMSSAIMKCIEKYMSFAKEGPTPIPPVVNTWTVANAFESKEDSALLAEMAAVDPLLLDLSAAAEYLNMTIFLKKICLVIAIHVLSTCGQDSDKIADLLLAAKKA